MRILKIWPWTRNPDKMKLLRRAAASAALLMMIGLLAGCGQEQSKNQSNMKNLFESESEVNKEIVIDCLGDSITWGMYYSSSLKDSLESGELETGLDDGGQLFEDWGIYISGVFQSDPTYPEVLEEELNRKLESSGRSVKVQTVNDGICGDWVTKDTCKRMSCDPDIVVLLMGGNNYYFDIPIEGMLEYTVRTLKKQGKVVVLANYPYWPGESHNDAFLSANEDLKRVAEEENVQLIDLSASVEKLVENGEYSRGELFSPDHIHLSEKGYALIGNLAADALFEEIES